MPITFTFLADTYLPNDLQESGYIVYNSITRIGTKRKVPSTDILKGSGPNQMDNTHTLGFS